MIGVFSIIYSKYKGHSTEVNSESSISFPLNDMKYIDLIKVLSNFKLPQIKYYGLNYLPSESEETKDFMRNSIPIQRIFRFNKAYTKKID